MQTTKFIDTSRSYIPVDPASFPLNLLATSREDFPEDGEQILAYDAINVLPTAYGYKSYFGLNSQFDIDAIPSRVDKILVFQNINKDNFFVALTETGIFIKKADTTGAWVHSVVLTAPDEGFHEEWTYCTIANDLFLYRSREFSYWKMLYQATVELSDSITPPAAPTVTLNSGAGQTAGAYKYRLAYGMASGVISEASPEVSITVGASQVALVSWPKNPAVAFYRLYRIFNGVNYYLDIPQVGSGTYYYVDHNDSMLDSITGFPDLTWASNEALDISAPIPVIPTFLNMAGQRGIFSTGTRLGFWDTMNSVSYSSIDDFADFTPSLQTLAGSSVFSDVLGQIVNIQRSRLGFTIYSTKSVVHIRQNVESTFMWDSVRVLDVGISYPNQVTTMRSDYIQYAWTSSGFYRIEEAEQELIAPEFFDYMKQITSPKYLDSLAGRYVAVGVMDKEWVASKRRIYVSTVPPAVIQFPQDTVFDDLIPPVHLKGNGACYTLQGLEAAHAGAGASAVGGAGFEFGPLWRAYYRSHYSFSYLASDTPWGNTPCASLDIDGVELNFSPLIGRVDQISQTSANKLTVEDDPDTPWFKTTFLSFYARQTAFWRLADERLADFLQELSAKSYYGEKQLSYTQGVTPTFANYPGFFSPSFLSCSAPTETSSDCNLGWYVTEWGDPFWGISPCGFYMGRYAKKIARLVRKTKNRTFCVRNPLPDHPNTGWWPTSVLYGPFETPTALAIARGTELGKTGISYQPSSQWHGSAVATGGSGGAGVFENIMYFMCGEKYEKESRSHWLEFVEEQEGTFAVDMAFMEIAGWYNSSDPSERVAAGASCLPPASRTDLDSDPSSMPISDLTGEICGIPFEPIYLPPISPDPIEWPIRTVTIPASLISLQKGSGAPLYPTFYKAFVYDTHYKKWGTFEHEYKLIADYAPINMLAGDVLASDEYEIFGGLLTKAHKLFAFDSYPETSEIVYGKVGFTRNSFTHLEEFTVNTKVLGNYRLRVEGSLDGVSLEASFVDFEDFESALTGSLKTSLSARWYNLVIQGTFDLTYLEVKAYATSRR